MKLVTISFMPTVYFYKQGLHSSCNAIKKCIFCKFDFQKNVKILKGKWVWKHFTTSLQKTPLKNPKVFSQCPSLKFVCNIYITYCNAGIKSSSECIKSCFRLFTHHQIIRFSKRQNQTTFITFIYHYT